MQSTVCEHPDQVLSAHQNTHSNEICFNHGSGVMVWVVGCGVVGVSGVGRAVRGVV